MFGMHHLFVVYGKVNKILRFDEFQLNVQFTMYFFFFCSENKNKEYEQALEDLKSSIKSKKFADIRATATATIDIVENQTKSLENTKETICTVIRLFYSDCFLISLEEIWSF